MRILFVCTGNTCRSPMAEAILKSKGIPGLEVRSAGVYAATGQSASRFAQEVLSDAAIQHEHQSKQISSEEIEWATHILTMTESHAAAIRNYFPESVEKVFTLKEFAEEDGSGKDVLDPYGGSKADYYNTFIELKNLIDSFVNKLK
ncbi:low molecular weight protein arginine phosphatase [Bacillus sp. AGMB 02131]|uniref:Low molecular weight protein arginine phosphatase n=1 Tax=Peribacillus faecalis TaxID=2772559 RepID=A0A927CUR8_9BACI|nr:low molecular weight protein arginine phosphatase [Peribacillus faecalis]MBD3107097.1 low molecular weight protein arginine phosphatase [Peribacillus faecalis]